jgi:hypothetical protein
VAVRKKKFNPAKAKRKLDRLFSELILGRDERTCLWCGKNEATEGERVKIDNSHIIPRECLRLRWSPENSVALCFGCHKRRGISWHSSPLVAVKWLRLALGDNHCEALILASVEEFSFNQETAVQVENELLERLRSINPPPAKPLHPAQKALLRRLVRGVKLAVRRGYFLPRAAES